MPMQPVIQLRSIVKSCDARHMILFITLVGMMIRLFWINWTDTVPISDSGWYFEKALRIAAGEGYVQDNTDFPLWDENPVVQPGPGIPTAFWPVGYPAFLGALFFLFGRWAEPMQIAKLADVLLSTGLLWLTFACSRRLFQSTRAALVGVAILAFFPNIIAYTSLMTVEVFYLFLLMCSVWLLLRGVDEERHRWLVVAGITFAAATLTKPQTILMPLVLLAFFYRSRPRLLLETVALVYLTIVLLLTPWTVRNFRAFGHLIFISNNSGTNLWIGNNPQATGEYAFGRELFDPLLAIPDEYARDQHARALAIDYVRTNPRGALQLLPKKVLHLYLFDVDGFGWNQMASPRLPGSPVWLGLKIVAQLYYGLVVLLFVAALIWLPRANTRYFLLGPIVLGYFTLHYLPFFGGARFHQPFIPWYAIYAGALITFGRSRWRSASA